MSSRKISESGCRPIAVTGRLEPVRRPGVRPVPHDEQADAGRQPVEVALELVLVGRGLDRRQREGRLLVVSAASGAPHDEQNRASAGF